MPIYTIKIGTDAQVVAVDATQPNLVQEYRAANTFTDYARIIERRLPSPSPTIEVERSLALDAIDKSTHLTPEQKAQFSEQIRGAKEFDKIVFLGPYPTPEEADQVQRSQAIEGTPPPKPPLVIVFVDP